MGIWDYDEPPPPDPGDNEPDDDGMQAFEPANLPLDPEAFIGGYPEVIEGYREFVYERGVMNVDEVEDPATLRWTYFESPQEVYQWLNELGLDAFGRIGRVDDELFVPIVERESE